ncbi:Unknown protein [Arabidopsis thaliana]|uniref:Nucleolar protein 16 n=1 Tax=Arabidopsis thaliana TaxID=3702 RepID=Q9SRY0_ARATH|nr:Unknown protein [Arabidopsis thaliana]
MARSRRKYRNSRAKVRVALPKKNPNIFKPAFNFPPKLRALMGDDVPEWDDQASVIQNYKSFGVISNPNLLGIRARTDHMIQDDSLNVPPPVEPPTDDPIAKEFEPIDSGSELEEDGHVPRQEAKLDAAFGCNTSKAMYEISDLQRQEPDFSFMMMMMISVSFVQFCYKLATTLQWL